GRGGSERVGGGGGEGWSVGGLAGWDGSSPGSPSLQRVRVAKGCTRCRRPDLHHGGGGEPRGRQFRRDVRTEGSRIRTGRSGLSPERCEPIRGRGHQIGRAHV